MRAGTNLCTAAMLTCLGLVTLAWPGHGRLGAQAEEKVKLEWQLPARECLFYDSIVSAAPASKGDGQPLPGEPDGSAIGQDQPQPKKRKPVLLFGYEIDSRGKRKPEFPVQNIEQAIFQAAALTPKAASRAGTRWTETWQFDASQELTPPGFRSSYELVELADLEGHGRCAKFSAEHELDRPAAATSAKRWETLRVTTITWFSLASNCTARCEATVRGQTNIQKQDEAPPTHEAYTWVLGGRMDSAELSGLDRSAEASLLKGIEYIWARREKNGGWNSGFRPRGGTALALMTLLGCGVRADDARVTGAFALLATLPDGGTYEVAVSCMAYEALLNRRREDAGNPAATLTRDETAELGRMVKWLLDGRQENDTWRYSPAPTGKPWFTTSIMEFALRGLASAQRCGAEVPLSVVKNVAEEIFNRQAADGEFVKRVVAGEYRRGGVKVTRSGKATKARGWTYDRQVGTGTEPNAALAYASMTCAGVNCLASLLEMAQNADKAARSKEFGGAEPFARWKLRIEEAVAGGLAWLELNYMISQNRGEGYSLENQGQYFCFLHSLERCCTFSGVDWLGEHNWYDEGRAALILSQKAGGNWARLIMDGSDFIEDTCFAVLFLKKNILKPRWPIFTQQESE